MSSSHATYMYNCLLTSGTLHVLYFPLYLHLVYQRLPLMTFIIQWLSVACIYDLHQPVITYVYVYPQCRKYSARFTEDRFRCSGFFRRVRVRASCGGGSSVCILLDNCTATLPRAQHSSWTLSIYTRGKSLVKIWRLCKKEFKEAEKCLHIKMVL